jgi:hypothetical protein
MTAVAAAALPAVVAIVECMVLVCGSGFGVSSVLVPRTRVFACWRTPACRTRVFSPADTLYEGAASLRCRDATLATRCASRASQACLRELNEGVPVSVNESTLSDTSMASEQVNECMATVCVR